MYLKVRCEVVFSGSQFSISAFRDAFLRSWLHSSEIKSLLLGERCIVVIPRFNLILKDFTLILQKRRFKNCRNYSKTPNMGVSDILGDVMYLIIICTRFLFLYSYKQAFKRSVMIPLWQIIQKGDGQEAPYNLQAICGPLFLEKLRESKGTI